MCSAALRGERRHGPSGPRRTRSGRSSHDSAKPEQPFDLRLHGVVRARMPSRQLASVTPKASSTAVERRNPGVMDNAVTRYACRSAAIAGYVGEPDDRFRTWPGRRTGWPRYPSVSPSVTSTMRPAIVFDHQRRSVAAGDDVADGSAWRARSAEAHRQGAAQVAATLRGERSGVPAPWPWRGPRRAIPTRSAHRRPRCR